MSSVSENMGSNGAPGIVKSMIALDAATGSDRTVRSTASSSSVYIPGVCGCLRRSEIGDEDSGGKEEEKPERCV
jgi:hypothetical protein